MPPDRRNLDGVQSRRLQVQGVGLLVTSFDIRPIQDKDNRAIAQIIRQVLAELGAARPGFAWSDPELDAMAQTYSHPGTRYFVVEHQGTVMGGGGIAPFPCEYPQTCELQKMYFLPTARGQGVGNRLIDRLLATAHQLQYQGCYLETLSTMTRAIRLYEKKGFTPLAQALGCSGHTACNRFYWRPLTADSVGP
jgi:putative acetyltransferase